MARVCMFLMTPLAHDARVEKEATSLARAGHSVRVVAVADGSPPRGESRAGWSIVRVDAEPAPARLARRALARRARGGPGGAAPGTVIQLGGDRASIRDRSLEALKRSALRAHLALRRRAYARAALREA